MMSLLAVAALTAQTAPPASQPDAPLAATLPVEPAPSTQPVTEPAAPVTSPPSTARTRSFEPEASVQPPATQPSEPAAGLPRRPGQLHEVVVTADLDRTREQIAPSLGAVTYTIGPNQIEVIPGGENAPIQQVLLRAPGVVEDSFGQIHIRGEHANATYRVNGVLLPEDISSVGGFGQEIDTRIMQSVTLIDGSLPAQFGFHTAGIIDVTTKSGATLNHNEVSFYGGSYDTFQPGVLFGGTSGKLDYFVAASFNYNALGVENSTSSVWPLHDYTSQEKLFTYLSYRIDDVSRVMVLLNASNALFQIPDRPGVPAAFTLGSRTTFDSAVNNENQAQQDYYGVIAYQTTVDKLSYQISGFTRYGKIHFTPDPIGDLLLQGVASNITNGFFTNGVQVDASYVLDDRNTLRFGFIGQYTSESVDTSTTVFPVDDTGAQTSTLPLTIGDNRGNWGVEVGGYLQNEWKMTDHLTLNYGARYDIFASSFDNESQVSPRANLVWKIDDATTAHAGYARYFVPPPVQYTWPQTIQRFAGTSNAPANFMDTAPKVERSHYYDVGFSRQISPPWQVNLDGFYKLARPLIDSGQFGNAIIFSPFNYRDGTDYGAEISTTYKQGGLSLFGNFAWVDATGRDIITNQYLIGNDELAFIRNHYIKLDHEAAFTASGGVSYAWKDNLVYLDVLYGSGLRSGFTNDKKLPQYAPVNVGFEHTFHPSLSGVKDMRFRFDVINIFDEVYPLRNGTGIGVAAAQFGQRRTFLAGVTFDF